MAKSRNERRKAARDRLVKKQERFIARVEAQRLENNRSIVADNMSKPMERNFYPGSNMGAFAGKSHRGYVSAASGSMSKRSTQAVMMKSANKRTFDNYARPTFSEDDKWSWRVVDKSVK